MDYHKITVTLHKFYKNFIIISLRIFETSIISFRLKTLLKIHKVLFKICLIIQVLKLYTSIIF